jgi:iron-sulfur cluster assembly protein
METTIAAPVTFTPGALTEIRRLMTNPGFNNDLFLRIGAKGGGCSGLSYILEFDQPTENDEYFEGDGFRCIINKAQGIYLAGMEIDWETGLGNRGFTFKNPNATGTCGCGSSFSV